MQIGPVDPSGASLPGRRFGVKLRLPNNTPLVVSLAVSGLSG